MTTQNKEKQKISKVDLWRNLLDQHNLDLLDYYPGGILNREQIKYRCRNCGKSTRSGPASSSAENPGAMDVMGSSLTRPKTSRP